MAFLFHKLSEIIPKDKLKATVFVKAVYYEFFMDLFAPIRSLLILFVLSAGILKMHSIYYL